MSSELNRDIGRRIGSFRRLASLTAEGLAAKVPGLTGNGLAKIESGVRTTLPVDLVLEIAWALNVPPAVLLLPLGEYGAEVEIGEQTLPVADVYAWATGASISHDTSDAGGEASALAYAVMGLAKTIGELDDEIETRWTGSDYDEEAFSRAEERLRAAQQAMAQLNLRLAYAKRQRAKEKPADGDDQ